MAPFWVSTTATTSPRATLSPGFTSHSTSLPASMSAPSEGMAKTLIARPRQRLHRGDDVGDLRQGGGFQMLRIGHRHLGRADPATGASRCQKQASCIRAAISAASEPVRQPSSTTTARRVRRPRP
jgi:hypothetical protein